MSKFRLLLIPAIFLVAVVFFISKSSTPTSLNAPHLNGLLFHFARSEVNSNLKVDSNSEAIRQENRATTSVNSKVNETAPMGNEVTTKMNHFRTAPKKNEVKTRVNFRAPKKNEVKTEVNFSMTTAPKQNEVRTKVNRMSITAPKQNEVRTKVNRMSITAPKKNEVRTKVSITAPKKNEVRTKVNRMSKTAPKTTTKSSVTEGLPEQVINGIKLFVFFIGADRSGSSILGSLMDAHPHMVIANEWLFPEFTRRNSSPNLKEDIFNTLYTRSAQDKVKTRSYSNKGYTLAVDGLWQGTYDNHIEVIGDKTSGLEIISYVANKEKFRKNYEVLKKHLGIPIREIQAVRNPFDVVATGAITKALGKEKFRDLKQANGTFNNSKRIEKEIRDVIRMYTSAQDVKELVGVENVLYVHNIDLVNDPRGTLSRIFDFLEVELTEQYLDVCANKVFGSVSRSRNLVAWTQEEINLMETRMKHFEVLNRYNFTS